MKARMTVAQAIQEINRPIFTTREIAGIRGSSLSATSQALRGLSEKGIIENPSRGLWCTPSDPSFTPFALVPFLTGSHKAYISFLSALHLHGLIEQIPQIIYAATTSLTRVIQTSVGSYSFHRIHPQFFKGYDWYGTGRDFLVASPEKALVDCLYLASRKGKRFRHLPELHVGDGFSFSSVEDWIEQIPNNQIRQFVLKHLSDLADS